MEDDRDDEDARKQTTEAESMNATKDALTMLSTANTVKFSNQQEQDGQLSSGSKQSQGQATDAKQGCVHGGGPGEGGGWVQKPSLNLMSHQISKYKGIPNDRSGSS